MRDGFTGATMTSEEAELARQRLRFLELVAEGAPERLAAHEVGWSWYKAKAQLAIPEFFEAVQHAIDRADDSIVEALHRQARKGNVAAIQMWLYNRRPNDWRDTKRIEVVSDHTIHVEVAAAVKQSALEMLREHGVSAMRQLGEITREAIEVEGVEVDDGGAVA